MIVISIKKFTNKLKKNDGGYDIISYDTYADTVYTYYDSTNLDTKVSLADEKNYDNDVIVGTITIDGTKYPVHRKKILKEFNHGKDSGKTTISHNITKLGSEKISFLKCDAIIFSDGSSFPLPYISGYSSISTYVNSINQTNIILWNNASWDNTKYILCVTLEYILI